MMIPSRHVSTSGACPRLFGGVKHIMHVHRPFHVGPPGWSHTNPNVWCVSKSTVGCEALMIPSRHLSTSGTCPRSFGGVKHIMHVHRPLPVGPPVWSHTNPNVLCYSKAQLVVKHHSPAVQNLAMGCRDHTSVLSTDGFL